MKKRLLWLIMISSRIAFYGLLTQIFFISVLKAHDGAAQQNIKSVKETNITLSMNNASVEEVFAAIEKKSDFRFFYDRRGIDRQIKLDVTFRNAYVSDVLMQLSKDAKLKFKQVNDVINVTRIDEPLEKEPFIEVFLQAISVSGRVVSDDSPDGLPGVNVVVKGTNQGTVTDIEGNFQINVPSPESVLVFSSVGFVTEEVTVGEQSVINISMIADITSLSEIVVVGYGTQKRSDITGSVASVPKERLSSLPVTNLMHAVQGTTAGLTVTQDSSVPGSSGTWQIRGVNSINANTSPFIVLDGVPFFGETNDINPNDIESIEILKDASAVAIYGTRGANGVILITTKRGKASDGKPRINYSGYYGTESMAHVLEPMSPDAYVQKYADYLEANNQSQTGVLPNSSEIDNYNAGITTDWLDEATQRGHITEHNLSIAGGTPNVQYYVSGSRLNQEGVVKGYQYKRTSFRTNVDAKVTDYLKVGTSAFFTENNYDGGRANFLEAAAMSPYSVPVDENGDYIIYPMAPEQLFLNPLIGTTVQRLERGKNLTGTGYLELAPGFAKGLKYRLNASYIYNIDRFADYSGRSNNDLSGTARFNNTETSNWVVENLLMYEKDFGKHHVDVTALYSAQEVNYFRSGADSRGFTNDALSYYNTDAGATQTNWSEGNKYTLLSQMGRVNYSYDSRYLLTLTARRDGYSAFGANTSKYGLFPSMAIGWNMANESFMNNSSLVNQLKVRFSYGQTGNQAINVNQTASTASTVKYPFSGNALTGVLFNRLGNADLNWETTTAANLGIDFGILQGRISGTIEVYKTKTEDILLQRNLPKITGYDNVWVNLGEMQNKGLEVTLNTINIETDNFQWETILNFSTYKNEILELYGDGQDDIGNRWFIGQPLRVIYDYEKIGIWQEGEDIASSDPVAIPGDIKFKDQNGDGQITADEDRIVVGQRDPKWIGGLTNTFKYRNFNLSIFLQTSQGGIRSNRDLTYADEAWRRNLPKDFKYWTPENPDNYWPSLAAFKNYRGYQFAEDYSYVRIKDVKLSYVVPQAFLDRYGIQGLTLYVVGRNLHTFTDWFGWDPEMEYFSRGSSNNSGGTWRNNYPVVRTVSFGLNLSL